MAKDCSPPPKTGTETGTGINPDMMIAMNMAKGAAAAAAHVAAANAAKALKCPASCKYLTSGPNTWVGPAVVKTVVGPPLKPAFSVTAEAPWSASIHCQKSIQIVIPNPAVLDKLAKALNQS